MQTIRITGQGSYLPRRMMGNADLPPLDKPITDAQIERLGVHSRGWAGPDESIAEMAAAAAQRALARAGRTAADLDFIVLSNWTQRRFYPDISARVQHLLGASRAFAFDVSAACAGFAVAAGVARGLLHTGNKVGLIVASETTSQRARPNSKATLVFGDAAGAWILEGGEGPGGRLLDVEIMTDGRYADAMDVDEHGHVRTHIQQKELQQLAIDSFRGASERVLARAGLTLDDVDWVVPHSGTAGIQALLVRTLDLDPARVLINFPQVGNVSSAAIPVALDAFVNQGVVKPGDLVLSPTTGSGWYAAALLYRA